MPEGLEAEIWRAAATPLVGRTITDVWVDERIAPVGLADTITGAEITSVDRVAKVLLLGLESASVDTMLGLHFGMTGRLEVDGDAPIDHLEYASGADRPAWDRLRIWAGIDRDDPRAEPRHGPALRLNDPRRLGRVSLDADLLHIGPDAMTLTARALKRQIGGRRATIKTLLLDQEVVGGLGNLCVDEVLWAAGVAPHRPGDQVDSDSIVAIARACRQRLPAMLERGGSTMGTLSPELRSAPGMCPRDGSPLVRSKVGGRTSVWCPQHQK